MVRSSNEFAELVTKLHQTPNDSFLKKAVIKLLPKMVSLSKSNPLALYHLAHIYPPTSPQFQHTMREAANAGCTSAMFTMCQILLRKASNEPQDASDLARYLKEIDKSEDSYVREETQKLINQHAQHRDTSEQKRPDFSYVRTHRFFTTAHTEETERTPTPTKPHL